MIKIDSFVDISDKFTVNTTTFSDSADYKVVSPNDRFVLISQISFTGDSNFLANGRIQAKLNGKSFSTSNSVSGDFGLNNPFTLPFGDNDFIFIEPQNSLDIFLRDTAGSSTAQISVSGTILSREEFNDLKKKYFGDVINYEKLANAIISAMNRGR